MARYIDVETALKIIDNYAKTVTADGIVVVKAIRDIVEIITPTADVVPKSDLDLLKSTIAHKEEEAYNKGYADAKADILEKLQADIARDEILAEYGDEFFEGRIAGFKAVINYLNVEDEE